MAATPPPGYTPPPADLPQRGDRATFSNRVDAWVTWFSTVILTQLAAMIANAYANALDAAASALSASGFNDTAQAASLAAGTARDTAQTYRDQAQAFRDQASSAQLIAENARDQAVAAAAAATSGVVIATSTTSNPLALGDITYTVPAGKQFVVNVPIIAVDPADPYRYNSGYVKSYSGTTLVITSTKFGGSGTLANWNISVAGVQGAQGVQGAPGGVTGGNLTGAINELRGADITAGPTPDIWSTGNLHRVTSTDTITGFPDAPQAGAERVLWIDSAGVGITNSASLAVEGGSTTLRPGDMVTVRALSVNTFRVTIVRADGTAVVSPPVYAPTRREVVLQSTQIFTPTVTGWHLVIIVGGGGRGGRAFGITTRATGAGAPGLCVKWCWLVAGTGYLFTAGAGAAAVATASGAIQGVAGSASTFAAPGGTMTANGGGGGAAAITAVATLAGGPGGTASGGDLNITGGRGGNISVTGSPGTVSAIATGAGSVGLNDQGYNGGDATLTATASTNLVEMATGGAGVGGKGGSINFMNTVAATNVRIVTAAGGAGGAPTDVTTNTELQTTGGVNALGDVSIVQTNQVLALLGATAGGTPSVTVTNQASIPVAAPGAGSAGVRNPVSSVQRPGGALSGTGGLVNSTDSNAVSDAPGARFGVSSGGQTGGATNYAAASTGAAGIGFAIIKCP